MRAVSGVYAAVVTPRREGPEIDLAAAFEMVDFVSKAGVAGIVLMGPAGEFPHFTLEERSRLVALAVKRSRVPVIAGVGHSTFDGALMLAREAADAGAAGVLLMPPYFFRYGADDVRQFYLCFAERIKGAVPVFLHNAPEFASPLPCDTAVELLEAGQFAGIEDSSGSWEDFERLKSARERHFFSLLMGYDGLFPRSGAAGADGIVSAIASAVPELVVAADRAIHLGQTERLQGLECRLREFLSWIDLFPVPVAIRKAAALRGLRVGENAAPLSPESEGKLGEFTEWFRGWLPAVEKECSHA
jgi:4-hydroxy-tetrahydrodipicolinate synthase